MKSLYEKINGSYVKVGDVKIPTLMLTETNCEVVFWGQRHKEYLKQNHRVIYYNLLTQGKLNSHLRDVDIRAKEMYDRLLEQLSQKQGVTEELKAENQMLWAQKMNNIANQVREIIFYDVILTINK